MAILFLWNFALFKLIVHRSNPIVVVRAWALR